jgi:hypothetical protein
MQSLGLNVGDSKQKPVLEGYSPRMHQTPANTVIHASSTDFQVDPKNGTKFFYINYQDSCFPQCLILMKEWRTIFHLYAILHPISYTYPS